MTTSNNTTQAANKEIHEEFERRYAMDADDPASAIELGHFANGWRAAVSKLRAPITDLRPHLEWALRRIRTSLDTGDKYEAAQAALDAAVAAPVASAPVAEEAKVQIEYLDMDNHRLRRALQKLMARLTDLLDEDQFANCESIVTAAGVEPPASTPVAGEAQPSRQTLLDAIWRHGNARAMAEHNIAYRDEVRNTADALIALFDAAPQASAEYERGHADGWAAGWDQAIKQPQADKDGGQQRAGDGKEPR
ncbi:hypothetical protein ACOTH0_18570 [Achromobacter xylosoxidans]